MAEAASAANYYVAKTGNDANPGTEASPWLTIQKGANTAIAGDTVIVRAGIYNEKVTIKNSGSEGKWITLKADPNAAHDTVIIDGKGIKIPGNTDASGGGLVYINGKSYVNVSGFRIQYAYGTAASSGAGVLIRGNPTPFSHITIENNHIYNTSSSGINALGRGNHLTINRNELEYGQNTAFPPNTKWGQWAQEGLSVGSETGGVDQIIVSNNHLHHDALWMKGAVDNPNKINGCAGGPGIDVKDRSTNVKIFGNEIDHIGDCWGWGFGIYIGAVVGNIKNYEIYNNVVHDIQGNAIVIGSEGGALIENINIYNNLIYKGNDVSPKYVRNGILIAPQHYVNYPVDMNNTEGIVRNIRVFNNVVYGMVNSNGYSMGIIAGDSKISSNITITNNILSNNNRQLTYNAERVKADHNLIFGATPKTGDNPVVADPQFIDPSTFDFHLKSTSPAIDKGSSSAPTFDFDGNTRPVGAGFDIGAYEYCNGSSCVVTPDSSPNPSPSPTQLTLKPGWNQISSPVAVGINLATIEQSCTILPYKNQKLWAWNATAQVWTNPAKVEPFKGYWIYAAYQCTVPLSGTPATFSSIQLYKGWNKISASGSLSAISGTCAGHITGNWLWHWDKATEKWIHPTTMQLDKGYWIKVDQDCVMSR